ncbi:hypothetical protein BABA_02157 [Neobacillus bataviensis LMG 21833]|uniref:Uncharacterized protein n=1 Tax=Neobacillus bataviensis LMG 21833 TaxID=1117379 RepID=K6DFG6_9BACI|nr:hypothetical protein [Neobacillus bataviensis]EKN71297.1 hypothetical protein BABA_02157 [Neobacillus bataviensis LMG 21833]
MLHKQEELKGKIESIKQAIESGDYQHQVPMMKVQFAEMFEEVRNDICFFHVNYFHPDYTTHFKTFISMVRKAKNELLADLQDVSALLSARKKHEKQILSILNRLLDTDLRFKPVQKKIDGWKDGNTRNANKEPKRKLLSAK